MMIANRFLDDDAFRAVGRDDQLLVLAVDPHFLGDEHARAEHDAFRAHGERCGDLAAGADAAADHDRHRDRGGCMRSLDHAADLVDAGMAAAFGADDDDRVDTEPLGVNAYFTAGTL